MLRDSDTRIFRQPSGTTTLNLVRGTLSSNGTDHPLFDVNSLIGSDFSTFTSITLSADLMPGTYTTTRTGEAQAVLDAGSFMPCGGTEPGTLTVTQAALR